MAVSLIDSAVSGKEIKVAFALYVPHEDTLSPLKYARDGMVIMSTVRVF